MAAAAASNSAAAGGFLRRAPTERSFSKVLLRPARVAFGGGPGFPDEGHLRYYAPLRCGGGKKEKRREKLVMGLERDLMEFSSMGFRLVEGEEVKGKMVSEAADLLLAQLTQMRTEAKERKRRKNQEKAAMKASKMKDSESSSSSSSSESSDSECETKTKTVVKRSSISTLDSLALPKLDSNVDVLALNNSTTAGVVVEAEVVEEKNVKLKLESGMEAAAKANDNKIEVCMGGKCKKSGAMELLAEFDRKIGIEGAVVGCKCMGKCKEGPNVRVVNRRTEEEGFVKVLRNPLCIGVGLEDVGAIVSNFFGERKDDASLLAA